MYVASGCPVCFLLFLVFVFVQAILSWCHYNWPVYIVCNIFSLNISLVYINLYTFGNVPLDDVIYQIYLNKLWVMWFHIRNCVTLFPTIATDWSSVNSKVLSKDVRFNEQPLSTGQQ